jgi:hypothetical protein
LGHKPRRIIPGERRTSHSTRYRWARRARRARRKDWFIIESTKSYNDMVNIPGA